MINLSGCFCWGCFVPLGPYPTSPKETEGWERAETSAETRLADWQACGGGADGHSFRNPKDTFEGEDITVAYTRQRAELQRCLLRKGYHYIGGCKTEYWKSMPACGSE